MEIAFLWIGLGLLAVAAFLTRTQLNFQKNANICRGRVMGFTQVGKLKGKTTTHSPVVEFVGPDGNTYFLVSGIGSAPPSCRVGDIVEVFVQLGSPLKASLKWKAPWIVAGIFGGMGLVFTLFFFVTSRVNLFDLLISLGITLFMIFMVRSRLNSPMLQAFMKNKGQWSDAIKGKIYNSTEIDKIPFVQPQEAVQPAEARLYRDNFKVMRVVFGAMGFAAICFSIYTFLGTKRFLIKAHSAQGKVIEMVVFRDMVTRRMGVSNIPIVEFQKDGIKYQFKHWLNSKTPRYRIGEELEVFYDPEDPGVACINLGLWNYLVSMALGVLGGLFFLTAKRVSRK